MNKLEETLGFGKGYISKLGNSTPNATKIKKIADYFNVSVDYLMTGNESDTEKYYLNDETAQVAQEIFENKELKALFDVQKDMDPDDLKALHSMALALKRRNVVILTTADVNVIVMDFPNKRGHEMVVPNEDGSYTIFINAGLNRESQLKAYEHARSILKMMIFKN